MKIILPDQAPKEIEFGHGTVSNLLKELGINPLEVLVSRNGTLVPEETVIGREDEIRVIRIAHGG